MSLEVTSLNSHWINRHSQHNASMNPRQLHNITDKAVFVSLDEARDTAGGGGVGFHSHPVYDVPGVWKEAIPEGRARTCICFHITATPSPSSTLLLSPLSNIVSIFPFLSCDLTPRNEPDFNISLGKLIVRRLSGPGTD